MKAVDENKDYVDSQSCPHCEELSDDYQVIAIQVHGQVRQYDLLCNRCREVWNYSCQK